MNCLDAMSQIPRLGRLEIEKKAQELLDLYFDGSFPVNIESVCDYLGLAIMPVRGLKGYFGVDAFIAADFKTIYVDEVGFRAGTNRYRFSLAHEIGHFVLHREYFPNRIESLEEWIGSSAYSGRNYVEYQANYFAGCLLAPEDELIWMLNTMYDGNFARNYYRVEQRNHTKVLTKMRRWFMVSEQVMTRRMQDVVYGL